MAEQKSYLSADDFLTGITGREEDYDVPNLGLVRLRSLTTLEVRDLTKLAKGDNVLVALYAVQVGLVEPRLAPTVIDALWASAAGFMSDISNRILELSGMKDRAGLENLAGAGS